jgi:hypothetical protein
MILWKFKLLSKECDELKSKLESNETKPSNSVEVDESSIPCAIPIFKVDASTSCIDLIDESCSPSCNENVVLETCDCLIGKKNNELKQEVKWLRERLASLMSKGKSDEEQVDISQDMKSKVQPSQDNCDPMVKKLEKGATVTCYKCHGEGHKFYKCPQFVKKMDTGGKEEVEPHHQEPPHLHQAQPQEQDQEQHLRHQEEGQWKGGCTQGWEDEGGAGLEPTHLGSQGSHHQHEGASNGLGSKGHLKDLMRGLGRLGTKKL